MNARPRNHGVRRAMVGPLNGDQKRQQRPGGGRCSLLGPDVARTFEFTNNRGHDSRRREGVIREVRAVVQSDEKSRDE